MSQSMKIRKYLESGKTLTALKALKLFDCLSLAQRVSELRGEGWLISSDKVRDDKTGKYYSLYKWVWKEEEISV